ncbi:MAG: hypothetical protein P4L50_13710 [Anaerolineaceae bacterium]|nr:hypothetical protein [Anaerolineaceae bacterium]
MNSALTSSLWIALIGIGLVFIALLLLWGLKELMVKLTAKQAAAEPSAADKASGEMTDIVNLRHRAAAAAVAYAIAIHQQEEDSQPDSFGANLSGWQPVLRASQLNQRSHIFSRKQRGSPQ